MELLATNQCYMKEGNRTNPVSEYSFYEQEVIQK